MINNHKIPIHNPNIIWQEVDDGIVLVTPQEGKVRALNHLGADIWRKIDGRLTVSDINKHISLHYPSIPAPQIEKDLNTFIAELNKRQLILWQPT